MLHEVDPRPLDQARVTGPTPGGPALAHVVGLTDLDCRDVALVGGKGAALDALNEVEGVAVPDGFTVTTAAYRDAVAHLPSFEAQLDRLGSLAVDDLDGISALSAELRRGIEGLTVPADVAAAVVEAVRREGEGVAFAVRSSATAEDSPTASFAGQHDSYLNVVGEGEVLRHLTMCWASLFSERAVAYRRRNGIDPRSAEMAVVVQRLVDARASGVLFTADPVSGNRKVATVEATVGLGEALVAGAVAADTHKVRDGRIIGSELATAGHAIRPAPGGGTTTERLDPADAARPALTDDEVLELVALGRRIEAHLAAPQDIEWCLDGDGFHIVQSRPITTLFPVPEADDDTGRVYVSVGHGQMMTDPMSPLGLSVWQLTSPAAMRVAGGRLFVDVTPGLSAAASRGPMLDTFGRSDPLLRDALETVLARGDVIPTLAEAPDGQTAPPPGAGPAAPDPLSVDPALVPKVIERNRASVAELRRTIAAVAGPELVELVRSDIGELQQLLLDPESRLALMAGFEAAWWLNDHLDEWLGVPSAADVLSLSAPGNVTAEMGLALLDVADVVRPHPEVVELLRRSEGDGFLDELPDVAGGVAARDAIVAYLDAYGMRCTGEIDIARPRWHERPSALVPLILANVANFEPGEHQRRVEDGRRRAEEAATELAARLRALPGGNEKAARTEAMARCLRTFIGYREHPKYAMVSRYAIYKQALLREAGELVAAGVLGDVEDIFYLTLEELYEVTRSRHADRRLIAERRADLARFARLAPPRVLTSDGEGLNGAHRRADVPPGALVGLGVSAGTVEGRARVVHDIAHAGDVEPGDILVTAHTDPSWSPLFVTVAGLVTEAGGAMTHGAVIAREYGLAAVVGVDHATERIRDGQRLRVDGTSGLVEIVDDEGGAPTVGR